MNFAVAMVQYIDYKRENGYAFERGKSCLFALSRRLGDITLEDVCAQHVLGYLNESQVAAITRRMRYQILARFFSLLVQSRSDDRASHTFVPTRTRNSQHLRSLYLFAYRVAKAVESYCAKRQ